MRNLILFVGLFVFLLTETPLYGQYGSVYTIAGPSGGSGSGGFAGDGGLATAAAVRFSDPTGIAVDTSGNVYILDSWNNRIRKVNYATGILTTIAGNGTSGCSGDGGPGPAAEIGSGSEDMICTDIHENVYFSDYVYRRIRELNTSTGIINTVAGNGSGYSGDGGPATSAGMTPSAVYVDVSGNMFIAGDCRIRKVDVATGNITTIAGNGTSGFSGDGGAATSAHIDPPFDLTGDIAGNIYFTTGDRIRKIDPTGIISTITGGASADYSGDGGPATAALLNGPEGLAVDTFGNVYFVDYYNYVIREIHVGTGIINTVAGSIFGSGDGGFLTGSPAARVQIYTPDICVDRAGNLYYNDELGWTDKILGASSVINTMSATDSLATASCTLPGTVDIGVYGTINGIPASTDSVKLVVQYGEFGADTEQTYTIPYWHSSTYGFGSIYSNLGSYTYHVPGTYRPRITISTLDSFVDVIYAPSVRVGSICDSAIAGIGIDTALDSFISSPCSIPMDVRYKVAGVVDGVPAPTDSVYVVYQVNAGNTVQIHTVPITLSGTRYVFHDTLINPTAIGPIEPNIYVAASSGNVSFTRGPLVFTVDSCHGGSITAGISDTATLTTYCSLPFTDKYSVGGNLNNYADTCDSVRVNVNFGDGSDTAFTVHVVTDGLGTFSYSSGYFAHTYTMPGVLYAVDSSDAGPFSWTSPSTSRNVGLECSPVSGILYIDSNLDCIHQPNEVLLAYWPYALINNTVGDTTYGWCDDSGHYALELIDGDNYTMIANPSGFSWYGYGGYGGDSLYTSCPSTGTYTVAATTGSSYIENFAFGCAPPSDIDVSISGWGWGFVPGDTGVIGAWSSDYVGFLCDSLYSTVTLTLDPLLTYVGMWDGPAPTVSGSTLTWTFSTTHDLFDFYVDVKVVTSTSASLGANVCNMLSVTPTALPDPDLSNNSYSWCEPVQSSWDPNEKQVSPLGTGPEGYISNGTPLSYMIHFQNTGTAPARNITVNDTINANLEISTLQIINSSAPVLVYQEPGNLIKFRFNDINLPDSASNPMGSIGYVAYNILPKPDLPGGTQITNDAGIYFDYNPAVVTNTTLNTINVASLQTGNLSKPFTAMVYPNPATNALTIKTSDNNIFSVTLTDVLGHELVRRQGSAGRLVISVVDIPGGMYFVKIISADHIMSSKVMVEH